VVEAVRQRCSHIAATKADQVYGVIYAALKMNARGCNACRRRLSVWDNVS